MTTKNAQLEDPSVKVDEATDRLLKACETFLKLMQVAGASEVYPDAVVRARSALTAHIEMVAWELEAATKDLMDDAE